MFRYVFHLKSLICPFDSLPRPGEEEPISTPWRAALQSAFAGNEAGHQDMPSNHGDSGQHKEKFRKLQIPSNFKESLYHLYISLHHAFDFHCSVRLTVQS